MFKFSEEVLHQATFLHERDVVDSGADYSFEYPEHLRLLEQIPQSDTYISKAKIQLKSRAGGLTSEKKFPWVLYFSHLVVEGKSADRQTDEVRAAQEMLGNYFNEEAYASPFYAASAFFISEVDRYYKKFFSTEHISQIYADLAKWYISRLVETARFVLHLDYSRSGLNYRNWSELFQQFSVDKNPWSHIFVEFPVLLRWLTNIYSNTQASLKELFQRLEDDRVELESVFAIPESAKVSAIVPNLSDPHRGGRTVMRLAFSNGSTIIYKPKPLTIEFEFNKFAEAYQTELGIIALKVLPRPSYGWVEDAGDKPTEYLLQNPTSIGRAAACFWLLNATDLHFENVRPTSNGVYALDLETLLEPPIINNESEYEPVWRQHSINSTLLFSSIVAASGRLLNISGFNPTPNISLPNGQVHFDIADDKVEMTIIHPTFDQPDERNLSVSHDSDVVSEVVDSFGLAIAKEIRKLVENFVLNLDDHCKLRFVFRDTYFYSRLLDRMRQPRFMRDGALLSLDLLLLHGNVPLESKLADKLHKIVDDEIHQLLQGDIPYFSYEAGNLALHTSDEVLDDFFKINAKDYSLAKVRELENSDIAEQSALVTIALGQFPNAENGSLTTENELLSEPTQTTESLLLAIKDLAENIAKSAFRPFGTPARWFSLFGDVSGEELRVDVGDRGFFGGAWGIILALQAAESALTNFCNINLLREFLDNQAEQWSKCLNYKNSSFRSPELLGFSGIGGEVFAQSILHLLSPVRWGFLRDHIGKDLGGIETNIANDKWLDVIGGSAGLVLGCEQLLRGDTAPETVDLALKIQQIAAMHLIEESIDTGEGFAWKVPKEKNPLLGFAHGWAGIVTALTVAERRVASESQKSAIQSCLPAIAAYPQNLLRIHRQWKDYRSIHLGDEPLNRSWCNGVPGFLRGMLEIEKYWTEAVRSEIHSMVGKIKTLSSSNAYRFCCGEMGNIDFLLDYSRAKYSSETGIETHSKLLCVAKDILEFANQEGKNNRQMPELSFPGLFQGQAGLIYCSARFVLPHLPSLSGHYIHN